MKGAKLKTVVIALAAVLLIAGVYFIISKGASSPPATTAKPKDPDKLFTITLIAPLSGPLQLFGASMERGAQIAAIQLKNSGKVAGRSIQLLVVDSAGDPQKAFDLAQAAVTKHKTNAIVGTFEFEESEAVAEVVKEAKLPFLMISNGPLRTCQVDDTTELVEYFWQLGMTGPMWVEPFLVYLADKHSKATEKFLFSYFGTGGFRSRAEADFVIDSAESLGFGTVLEEYPDPRIRDHYETLDRLLRRQADVLFVTVDDRSLPVFMKQVHKMSVRRDLLLVGLNSFVEENINSLGSFAEGIYTAFGYHSSAKNKENKAFLKTWRAKYPQEEPTSLAVMSYSSIHVLAAALKKGGSVKAESLQKALAFTDIELPQGRVLGNDQNHSFTQPLYAGYVEQEKIVLGEYLGDVSHPSMKGCEALGAPPPTPSPTPKSRYQ